MPVSNTLPVNPLVGLLAGALLVLSATAVRADPVADFYQGKTVKILVGSSAGGEFDVLGRLIGRHIGRHIPGNPTFVVVNMPGAFGLPMSNHLYARADQDGSVLGMVNNNHPMLEAMSADGVRFKTTEFQWIGSIAPLEQMMVVWAAKGVKTIEDARKTDLVVGAMGRGNLTYALPAMMNDLIGTRFKIVTGYTGGPEMNIAMERGEVDARSISWSSVKTTNPAWIRDHKIEFLVQAGPRSKEKELLSLPSLESLARNDEDRAVMNLIFASSRMGRPLAAPPGIPADRLAALRDALDRTMKDPAFLHEANAASITVDPVRGLVLQEIVAAVQNMPKAVAQRGKKYLE